MRAVLYARQSKGDASVDQQLELAATRAAERGWTVVGRYHDRSVSATTGEPRPGYDAMMGVIKAGGADAIVVRHYDRLYRQPRELEGLIDATEGVRIESVYGGAYDLGTADGRMQARVVGAFARGEAEKKAERQRLAAQRNAAAGKVRKGCPRPFGWLDDRVTAHPQEGPAVADACRALLAGGTLTGVARAWEAAGLRPPQGAKRWGLSAVRKLLMAPRVAGISAYKGTEVGRGEWEALVGEDTYRAVVRLLGDPRRKPSQGTRTFLGGVARCQCGNVVVSSSTSTGIPGYRCARVSRDGRPGPHVHVKSAPVDEFVGDLAVAIMQEHGAALLLAPSADPARVQALHDEAQGIRKRMGSLGPAWMRGVMSEADMLSAREAGTIRLAEIDGELADLGRQDVLAPLVGAENIAAAWEGLGTDRRRAVVARLMTVELHPAGRGARTVDLRRVVHVTPVAPPHTSV